MADARAPIDLKEPQLDKQLIAWLRALYPPRCIGKAETPEQAHRYAGQVELVEHLADIYRAQTEPEEAE